jgi:proteasome accessory factor C
MRVTDLGWAQRLLIGLGPDVTVVGPLELVERIRAQAAAALDQYAAPPARAAAGPLR